MPTLTITLDPETAQRLAERAREEGVTPEEFAAHLIWDVVADYDPNDLERYPPLAISDEEFRASVEAQMREIAAGTAVTYSHEQVMAEMRAKIAGKKHDE